VKEAKHKGTLMKFIWNLRRGKLNCSDRKYICRPREQEGTFWIMEIF
jgi:hypothetical protein